MPFEHSPKLSLQVPLIRTPVLLRFQYLIFWKTWERCNSSFSRHEQLSSHKSFEKAEKSVQEEAKAKSRRKDEDAELQTSSEIQIGALRFPNPQILLGQGKIDPFSTTCTNKNLSVVMTKAWHFTFDALWPKDVAGLNGLTLEKWTLTTRGRGVSDPFMLLPNSPAPQGSTRCSAWMWRRKKCLLNEKRKCRKVTFRLVSEAINARIQDTAVVDTLIHAILLLGTTEAAYMFTPKKRVLDARFPMMDAFIYELYGHFAPSNTANAHHQAILTLVEERGGPENVFRHWLINTSSTTDIAIATWNNIRPFFPLRQVTKSLLRQQIPVLDSLAVRLSLTLGAGFHILDSSDIDSALRNTISEACRLTILVEQHKRHEVVLLNIKELSLAAIAFQHGVYSLVPLSASELRVATITQCLGEAIRIAMFIYSTRVFYPPIRPYNVEVRAAREIKICTQYLYTIEATEIGLTKNNKYMPLMKWLLVLGSTSAESGGDTQYFVRELHERITGTGGNGNSDFESVADPLRTFLWWDYIFDTPLREVLAQVQELDGD